MGTNTVDFGNLTIDIQQSANEVVYRFNGEVDEHFRQREVPRIAKPNITFILEDIATFNSCGIREWIYLVREIGELGALRFKRCSVAMIDQINMVPDSLGKGVVESFFAPYYCGCGGEVNRLITVADSLNHLVSKHAPEFKCENCGNTLEFDALEESYFLFTEAVMPKAS